MAAFDYLHEICREYGHEQKYDNRYRLHDSCHDRHDKEWHADSERALNRAAYQKYRESQRDRRQGKVKWRQDDLALVKTDTTRNAVA